MGRNGSPQDGIFLADVGDTDAVIAGAEGYLEEFVCDNC